MKEEEKIVGLATIAPKGEGRSGEPTIVGLYVDKAWRKRGYGKRILQKTIERCTERGFEKIRIDVMSLWANKIIASLPEETRAKLVVHDHGAIFDAF